MFFRILKKDLKRKKTMNLVILVFILLATMFVASGISNVVVVMQGTDSYLDQAGIGDYVVVARTEAGVETLQKELNAQKNVKGYRSEPCIFGEKSNLTDLLGKELQAKDSVVYQALEDSSLKFFDKNNKQIRQIEPGHAYVNGDFMETNHLVAGDKIRISHKGISFLVTLDGKVKDAFLGTNMMANTRFLLNKTEMDQLFSDEIIRDAYQGLICYIDLKEGSSASDIASSISNVPGVMFSGARYLIKMCYVMDMIVACLILVLSICLIMVSFVVLKFSITFTISEEFREIGVLKAIGIGNAKIRSLYLIKYMLLATVGAVAGLLFSVPFSELLLDSVSGNMLLETGQHLAVSIIGTIVVIAVILIYAFRCTKIVKNFSPIDAIRSGETGERYKKKSPLRLKKSHCSSSSFMAVNDVLSAPKRYATISITFWICAVFVLVLVNLTSTMRSDALITTFVSKSDLYYTDTKEVMSSMHPDGRTQVENYLNDTQKLLKKNGMPVKMSVEAQYKYRLHVKGKDYSVVCLQGINRKAKDYEYTEGIVPKYENEIAITPTISKMTGAQLGDTVTIDFVNQTLDCIVVAYFQNMNQLGQVIRLHEDAPTDFTNISALMSYQIDFEDHPSAKEIEIRKDKIKKIIDNDKVMNAAQYCDDCMGAASTVEAVQYLLLAITLIVVLLVCTLMEHSFIADETSQIAILKAIGFTDARIMKWHVGRLGVVTLLAVFLAAVSSVPMTYMVGNPIFGMMGARDVSYVINPWKIFLLYPGIIFTVTILATGVAVLRIRKIDSSDTANIE